MKNVMVDRRPDGRTLMDAEALHLLTARPLTTVRHRCTEAEPGLYDATTAVEQLNADPSDVVVVTASEARRYLGIAAGTIRSWASRGRLRAIDPGSRPRYAVDDLARLVATS